MRRKKAITLLRATLPGLVWRFTSDGHGVEAAISKRHAGAFVVIYWSTCGNLNVWVAGCAGEAPSTVAAAVWIRGELGKLHATVERALAPIDPGLAGEVLDAEFTECHACGQYVAHTTLDDLMQCVDCATVQR